MFRRRTKNIINGAGTVLQLFPSTIKHSGVILKSGSVQEMLERDFRRIGTDFQTAVITISNSPSVSLADQEKLKNALKGTRSILIKLKVEDPAKSTSETHTLPNERGFIVCASENGITIKAMTADNDESLSMPEGLFKKDRKKQLGKVKHVR